MNKAEALRILTHELDAFRSMSYQNLANRIGSTTVFTRRGVDGVEYQIEVEVIPDHPRLPQGDLRVIGSIDDGILPGAFSPLTQDFVKGPGGEINGEG